MKKLRGILLAIGIALGLPLPALAGFAEGAMAYNNRNYTLAYKEILPLAKAGNADAEHLLGLMYYMGRGVPQDTGRRWPGTARRPPRARPMRSTWWAPCTTPVTR